MTEGAKTDGKWRPWLKTMAGPSVIFFTLPWLMVLLILGTVAQRGDLPSLKLYRW